MSLTSTIIAVRIPISMTVAAMGATYLEPRLWIIGLICGGIAIFDLWKRLIEFKRAFHALSNGAKIRSVARRLRHSMCQRHVAITAAWRVGQCKEMRQLYWDMGYRWYHIFPDEGLHTFKFWRGFFNLKGS